MSFATEVKNELCRVPPSTKISQMRFCSIESVSPVVLMT